MKERKRLVFDLSEEKHRRIKEEAASRGLSIKEMVLEALSRYIKKPKH